MIKQFNEFINEGTSPIKTYMIISTKVNKYTKESGKIPTKAVIDYIHELVLNNKIKISELDSVIPKYVDSYQNFI